MLCQLKQEQSIFFSQVCIILNKHLCGFDPVQSLKSAGLAFDVGLVKLLEREIE